MASANGSTAYDAASRPDSAQHSQSPGPGTGPGSVPGPSNATGGSSSGGGGGGGGAHSTPSASSTPLHIPAQNGRKRKAEGTSSRGVANLTPEQLAKKRANDREAQRAIRERTKNTIENLERRINELESQQPFQELQNVIRSRDAVQAENDDLKRRMQSIVSLLQPFVASQGLNDLAAATAQQTPLPMPAPPHALMYPSQPPHVQQQHQQQQQQPPVPQYDAFPQHHLHPDLRNSHQSPTPQRPIAPPASGLGTQHDMRRDWHPSLPPAQYPHPQPSNQSHGPFAQDQHQQPDRYGLHHLLDERLKAASPAMADMRRRELAPVGTEDPLCKRLPLNTEPTCTLDSILLAFEAERRRAAQSGTPAATLVGPAYPSISSLLNPTRAVHSHPLSKVFTDILSKFPSISQVPEQVAVLYIMFLVMRWHIAPTQENFERLPEWARPVRSQLEVAHPAWIDHLPWPMMRDRLIRAQSTSAYPFDSFFIPYTTTLCLNWPYEPQQCLLAADAPSNGTLDDDDDDDNDDNDAAAAAATTGEAHTPSDPAITRSGSNDASVASSAIESALGISARDDGQEFIINPIFESHLRNLSNWSLGSTFRNAFPDLVEDVTIKDVRSPATVQT